MEKKQRKRTEGDAGRCTKQKSKRRYTRKRKYHGKNNNKAPGESQTNTVDEEQQPLELDFSIESGETVNAGEQGSSEAPQTTASASKIIDIGAETPPATPDTISGFRLVDMSILADVFTALSCPECHGTNCFNLTDVEEKKRGLARTLKLECTFCLYIHEFCTSKQFDHIYQDQAKSGGKVKEVNIRMVYGCRAIGSGYESLKKLCCYLNMPAPMTKDNYDKTSNAIKEAAKVVAERSMSDAASELRGNADTADIGVSVDGTWQKKGFTSTNGIITAISVDSGKVLDTCILSKSCKGCTNKERLRKTDKEKYERWKASHKCNQNYSGSSPNMEKVGAEKIFGRSVQKHKLYYTSFYGDGDSKAYPAVQNTYGPNKPMKKRECIGHYQKRIGNRLRKLRKEKKLGGKGRLTNSKIDMLQNYFGIVLRQHVGDLNKMVEGCMASMYHIANYHKKCPKTPDTWCQYQLDKLDGTALHKSKGNLPIEIRKAILPVYVDLCKPENLEKCLHGKTQNANESFNGMVWNRVPKATHVGLSKLTVGVYDAIAHFNNGEKSTLDIYKLLNVEPGVYTSQSCMKLNATRKRRSAYRMSDPQKKRRKIVRHQKKKSQDKNIEQEGVSYEYGFF